MYLVPEKWLVWGLFEKHIQCTWKTDIYDAEVGSCWGRREQGKLGRNENPAIGTLHNRDERNYGMYHLWNLLYLHPTTKNKNLIFMHSIIFKFSCPLTFHHINQYCQVLPSIFFFSHTATKILPLNGDEHGTSKISSSFGRLWKCRPSEEHWIIWQIFCEAEECSIRKCARWEKQTNN